MKKKPAEPVLYVEPETKPITDDYEDATPEDFDVLLEYLLPASAEQIRVLAHGRAVTASSLLIEGFENTLDGFDVLVGDVQPRTGNDENMNVRDNRRIIALVGAGVYEKVCDAAREVSGSNLSTFRAIVAGALERAEL